MLVFLIVILQLGLFGFLAMVFIGSIVNSKPSKLVLISAISMTLLMGICFYNYEMSSFNNEPYFFIFAILAGIGMVSFWLSKSPWYFSKQMNIFFRLGTGLLFWISLFTVIKFFPYMPFVWFPLYGIMAIAPVFFALMAMEELIRKRPRNYSLNPLVALGSSLALLMLIQFGLNVFTTSNWVLIELFNPTNTVV
jgi:hypothetical protein